MARPVVRALIAAAVTTAALVAVPQAAFASVPATDGDQGGIPIGVLVGASVPPSTAAPRNPTTTDAPATTDVGTAARSPARPGPAVTDPTTVTTGSDVSYPQCSATPPANRPFGVVGVNGGTAKDFNPCLGPEFTWASNTGGTTAQGTASLYVDTANPGAQGTWWPTADSDRPAADASGAGPRGPLPSTPITYPGGTAPGCSRTVDPYGPACAYVYGYVRAEQAVVYAQEQLGGAYSPAVRWWLDVETSTTWAGPGAANAAALAGAATYLARVGEAADGVGRVGIYSSTAQYLTITGGTGTALPSLPDGERSPLIGLPEWGAGASNLQEAQSNCAATPFTGGVITLTQFVSGAFDYDVACRGY